MYVYCTSIYLHIYISICPSIYLSIYLSISPLKEPFKGKTTKAAVAGVQVPALEPSASLTATNIRAAGPGRREGSDGRGMCTYKYIYI